MVFETERDMYQKIADKIKKFLWKRIEEERVEISPKHYDRIFYNITDEMIDHNGHVNFRFLCVFFENGFHEYMKKRHTSYDFLMREFGKTTFFRHQEINYQGELKLGDVGNILTGVSEIRDTSFTVHQIIEDKNGKPLVLHKIIVVMVDISNKQKSHIPDVIRERIISE